MDSKQYIEVATSNGAALIKVIGLGDMHLAPTLDDLTIMLAREGCKNVAIDLKECTGMDSTFMGTLISINVRFDDEGSGWMCLINVSESNQSLLKLLGVWKIVTVCENFNIDPVNTARIRPPEDDLTEKRLQIITKAHKRLSEISESNRVRFGPFLESLAKQIDENKKE